MHILWKFNLVMVIHLTSIYDTGISGLPKVRYVTLWIPLILNVKVLHKHSSYVCPQKCAILIFKPICII